MKKRRSEQIKEPELRERAESRLKSKVPVSEEMSNTDMKKLIHELEVHQIELKMQNDELRKTQVKLEESIEGYANLYDFAPVGYLTFNKDGLILDANLTIADMLAMKRNLLINSLFHYFVNREGQDIFYLHMKKVFEWKKAETCEIKLNGKNGTEFYARLDSLLVQYPRSNTACRTAITDITDNKKAIKSLQQGEEKYKTLVDAIPEIVYKIDENGYFTFLNSSVRNLGYEPEELIGKHFSKILHQDDVKNFSRSIVLRKLSDKKTEKRDTPKLFDERRSKERMTRNLEVRLATKNQDRVRADVEGRMGLLTSFGEIVAAGYYHDDAHNTARKFSGTVGIIIDITEKIKLQTEMIRAGQLALIGELAAGVAHEINNPIYSMINFAQLIADEADNDSRANKFGKLIIKEGNRIADLTANLVSLSRSTGGSRKPVNIHELTSNSLKLIEIQLEKDNIILIKDNIPKDIPPIIANTQEIHQVFLNLIQNARYALNKKYPGKGKDKIFEISCNKVLIDDCQYVRIIFYDRGIGIPRDILHKVKSLFFTTKPSNIGTGIGLSVSENIINNHDGKITIDSILGEFTRVLIDLPITEDTTKK